jgi:putative drug exporter of the RND superfamily
MINIPITGRLARLGAWTADHRRAVIVAWCAAVLLLGALAPFADRALSGAGWEAPRSESIDARRALESAFPGRGAYALQVVVAGAPVDEPATQRVLARVRSTLLRDPAVAGVLMPRPGGTIAPDHRTAIVTGLAGAPPHAMVEAAGRVEDALARLATGQVAVRLTGPAALWSDFNAANKSAMVRSEALSWPLTLALLVIAFGTVTAAGLPLMLAMTGVLGAGGLLFVFGQVADVSIWAMNFALMFAIALGIDYALLLVVRFRAALAAGLPPRDATVVTMDTAGKAVLASGLGVVTALLAVMLVPVPTFRSVPLGIVLAVLIVLAATLTLLPAALSGLGQRVNAGRLRVAGGVGHRSERYAAWARRLWARPLPYGAAAVAILVLLAAGALGLRTGMPTTAVVPADAASREGEQLVHAAFGPGAAAPLQIVVPGGRELERAATVVARDRGIAAIAPVERSGDRALITAVPTSAPGSAGLRATLDRLRQTLPPKALVGGAAAENRDVERALLSRLPLVVGLVVAIGFALLAAVLRSPLAAAATVAMNLLASAAAFGVARLVFQDGALAGPLGFESQGFVDAWAPIFFSALLFALAMDYSIFLLSAVREHRRRGESARTATVEALAGTGRIINAAAAVMIGVFASFALAGPLPVKEMGVILAVGVVLDTVLVRLVLQPVILRLFGARCGRPATDGESARPISSPAGAAPPRELTPLRPWLRRSRVARRAWRPDAAGSGCDATAR